MDVLIRDMPEGLIEKLDKIATREKRSRTQQIILILELATNEVAK